MNKKIDKNFLRYTIYDFNNNKVFSHHTYLSTALLALKFYKKINKNSKNLIIFDTIENKLISI